MQTKPPRLSGSLEGLACCSPPSRPPVCRHRLRAAHGQRTRANASPGHKAIVSGIAPHVRQLSLALRDERRSTSPHHKKKGAANARAQRAAATAQEDGLARRHAPARVRPQHRKTAAADARAVVPPGLPRLSERRRCRRPRRRPRYSSGDLHVWWFSDTTWFGSSVQARFFSQPLSYKLRTRYGIV